MAVFRVEKTKDFTVMSNHYLRNVSLSLKAKGLLSLMLSLPDNWDYIQAVYPYEDPVALICNEDGKFMGLPLNRALRDDAGEVYDIIAGNFLITGLGEESFSDLSPELMEKYKEQFLAPESFVQLGGKILAVKQPVPVAENKDMTQKPPHKSGPEL